MFRCINNDSGAAKVEIWSILVWTVLWRAGVAGRIPNIISGRLKSPIEFPRV